PAAPPAAAGEPPSGATLRERLAQADAALVARFDAGDDIDRLLRARAAAMDGVLRVAWAGAVGADAGLALFAGGGYGHGELFPQSDVDLLVIADEAAQARHGEALAAFFAMLWDAGVPLGQAVRSLAQNDAGVADITVLTAQLDARLLHGPADAVRVLG